MTHHRITSLLLTLGMLVIPTGNAVADAAFYLKSGSYELSDTDIELVDLFGFPVPIELDGDSDSAIAIGGEYRFDSGFAIGGELFSFTHKGAIGFPFIPSDVDIDTLALMVVAKKIFNHTGYFRPYIGAGIALIDVSLTGPGGTGYGSGIGAHAQLGAEIKIAGPVRLMLEYKGLSGSASDVDDQKIKVSGSGGFAGIALEF